MVHSLQELSNEDLEIELAEATVDLHICEVLLSLGIHEYGDRESVEDRYAVNKNIMETFRKEIERRKDEKQNTVPPL
jgi:hypothetical protein